MPLEIEVKLWIGGKLPELRKAIRALQFRLVKRRVFEQNTLFDTPDLALRKRGEIIRVRRVRGHGVLTFKGPSQPGPHKSREELEADVTDAGAMESILTRLAYQPVFRYEKFREEYRRPAQSGTITVDETPIGNFMELEGAPGWIDRTARELHFTRADYITGSYGKLYLAWCRENGTPPTDMAFQRGKRAGILRNVT